MSPKTKTAVSSHLSRPHWLIALLSLSIRFSKIDFSCQISGSASYVIPNISRPASLSTVRITFVNEVRSINVFARSVTIIFSGKFIGMKKLLSVNSRGRRYSPAQANLY
jgi:hypothetical protein